MCGVFTSDFKAKKSIFDNMAVRKISLQCDQILTYKLSITANQTAFSALQVMFVVKTKTCSLLCARSVLRL